MVPVKSFVMNGWGVVTTSSGPAWSGDYIPCNIPQLAVPTFAV